MRKVESARLRHVIERKVIAVEVIVRGCETRFLPGSRIVSANILDEHSEGTFSTNMLTKHLDEHS